MNFTSTHWGVYRPVVADGELQALEPAAWDADPSPIGRSMPGAITGPTRVRRPAVRAGFLRDGPGSGEKRGQEPFVELPWDAALDLAAGELRRVIDAHGNAAIFGGSYGWASAGRFHHAQSQLHRFLRTIGGYTGSVDSYSIAAGRVILRRVAAPFEELALQHTEWENLARHTRLFVAFGGLPVKNSQVNPGGASAHIVPRALRDMAASGVQFVNCGPQRSDLPGAEWLPLRPGSDTALMLALAHVLVSEGLHDAVFLDRCTAGFVPFRDYLLGIADGVPKDPRWAASITEIDADTIAALARRMAADRTMLNATWSLQRAEHGEQPYWMLIVLACLLGQIGLPGGGFGVGYSCMNSVGSDRSPFSGPRLPQGHNTVRDFIPCARIADMLLEPGAEFTYDGQRLRYPDIRLVYWAGGNAFHHHQDLNRLVRAWRRPETIIVHEQYWTAQAKFADIVFPATTSLERDDIGSAAKDRTMVAMKQAIAPVGEARDDHAILAALAERLGTAAAFTEGRTTAQWLRHLYDESRERAAVFGLSLPDFDAFWESGVIDLPRANSEQVMFAAFRADPEKNALRTGSGRIEIFSDTIAGFGYADCPGHPVWQPPREFLGSVRAREYPLHMLSNQPATRLHSQYDHGSVSRDSKIAGREPLTMHPDDAAARGIAAGDVVRVFNDRGAFLAGAVLSTDIRPGVVQIATGAWYDPAEPGMPGTLDKHGNPNTVTQDVPSSSLARGCAAQSALVEIARHDGPLPAITAFDPPRFIPA